MGLAARLTVLALVLLLEKFLLSFLVHPSSAQTARGLGAALWITQHFGFRILVSLALSLAVFSYASSNERLAQINAAARSTPLHLPWLALHGVFLLLLAPSLSFLYSEHGAGLPFSIRALLSALLAAAAVVALFATTAPWAFWRDAAKALGVFWLYALVTAVTATCAIQWSQMLWKPTTVLTFELVRGLLAPIIPSLQSDPRTLILSTDRFAVRIMEYCSGLEGAGLMLTFGCAWLLYFRKEYIFPRALILIPAGLLLIFALNVLRIAALVLIGHSGYPEVAKYGFHSQAGWIAFNIAACGIAFASRSSGWINRTAARRSVAAGDNPTAAYLLPFLAILAAGMAARAASSGFETLYSLRLIAGAAVLGACWRKLSALDWRCSWRGPLAGLAVFALWIVTAHFLRAPAAMPAALAAISPPARALWIVGRVAASVMIVPIAEELAFRGYLLRRIAAADFESVRFDAVGRWALLLSSVAFGLGHGSMWLPGVAAGLIYGGVLIRTGRMGEAVAAHATTNGLLAAYVLLLNQWQIWR
jgi:exosortase E/protease (VPEID-CTERM system)